MLKLVSALGLTLALAVPAAAEPFRLVVTDLEAPLVPNSIMEVALELGYFAAEGVDVELVRVQQTPLAIAALRAGEGDMANVGVDTVLQLTASGQFELRAVASPGKSLFFMVVARAGIDTPVDLAGTRFGIGRVGSVDQTLSAAVLGSFGVDATELQQVALGQPAVRAQALLAGEIDATTMSLGTWTSLGRPTELQVVIDADHYFAAAPVVNKVNVVAPEVLAGRGTEVAAVVRALVRLARDIAADPEVWVEAMARLRPDVDRAVLADLASAYDGSWSVNGGLSAGELAFTADWTFLSPDFAGIGPVPLDAWVAFDVLDAVLAELGGPVAGQDPADR